MLCNTGQGICIVEFANAYLSCARHDTLTGPKLEAVFHAPSLAGKTLNIGSNDTRRARRINP
jgi:sulfide:quinone oxidoreductase